VDAEALARLHRAMVLSRTIELFAIDLSPHWYPGVGEEAVVVGTFSGLREGDMTVPHYRGALIVPWLRGRELRDVLGCLIQRQGSPTGGRLYGSFVGALEHGVMPYVTMVLGPNLGVATGCALAFRSRGEERVAVATLGDGTAGTGDFHESLNLAAALALPVVFVCQNNQFSISTPASAALAGPSIAEWAARYGMPSERVDGNDVEAVRGAVDAAVARARAGGGPAFVEALTYRRTGHFGADPAVYRDAAELREWEERDPIARLEARLGIAAEDVWERCRAEVAAAAREAEARPALTAADLGLEEVYEHV
jgi:acetoin:2,6-dichlorophenolindophenol oxidoreductase subunit alpha